MLRHASFCRSTGFFVLRSISLYSISSADSFLPTRALWASLRYLNPAAELRLFREKLKMTQIAPGCRARRLLRWALPRPEKRWLERARDGPDQLAGEEHDRQGTLIVRTITRSPPDLNRGRPSALDASSPGLAVGLRVSPRDQISLVTVKIDVDRRPGTMIVRIRPVLRDPRTGESIMLATTKKARGLVCNRAL